MSEQIRDTEDYRDHIATVDHTSGKRIWIYPQKPSGRFTKWRTWLSWFLLLVLFGLPFIKVNGQPFVLLNVLERRFILFGMHFTPQDFFLFGLAMVTGVVFIVLFTVVFGRIFCGWICPQTIFMEMVFRKIEYWIEGDANAQRRLDKAPWTSDKILKKTAKHALFFTIAVLIANTFLAYIISLDEVVKIITEPVKMHIGGFISMIVFSFVFYYVFARMREQVCIAICPYGRLQGVMLDKNSIAVMYDWVRGEPRGKIKKQAHPKSGGSAAAAVAHSPITSILADVESAAATAGAEAVSDTAPALGDCIDCKLCIKVCPTGIDIRNGTQLECVNCTACIDACDEIMDKVDRPRGLIRYDSYNGIAENKRKIFNGRTIAYSAVLFVLLGINVFLLATRTDVEAVILRTPGLRYQEVDEQYISNLYNYQVINKTGEDVPVEFRLSSETGKLRLIGDSPIVPANEMSSGSMFVDMERSKLSGRKNKLYIEVWVDGKMIDRVKTNFQGPIGPPTRK
ncbi:MAG: 4Fe-4S binding protein [Saprospiraceae bacterium]|nr:4Fe-4S binding protein [Saprospiraceae bacterium]